jgi:ParB/RepB/Spo0J family partition protein
MMVKIDELNIGKNWSRTFGVGDTSELVASMREHGQITPVIIDGEKNLIAGFRRVAAATELGWEEIEAVVNAIGRDVKVVNLIENMQRENLTLWEEIQAIRDTFGGEASQSEIARQLSKTRPWVEPRVKIWDMPQDFIDRVRLGAAGVTEIKARLRGRKTGSATGVGINCPNQKELKQTITDLLSESRMVEARALSYALGGISKEELLGES